jgi:hypothetical protein
MLAAGDWFGDNLSITTLRCPTRLRNAMLFLGYTTSREITDKCVLVPGAGRRDVPGKCDLTDPFAFLAASLREEAARAHARRTELKLAANTGGPPVIRIVPHRVARH